MYSIQSNLIDLHQKRIYPAEIFVEDGKISRIKLLTIEQDSYIMPGFVDAHVHIESSLLVPSEFARLSVVHGTVATVSDPHEIANVLGMEGVRFMIQNGQTVPFKFNFGAPSCVPATVFETAGATIDVQDIETLMQSDDIKYLAEMMNWPGVLFKDEMVYEKIKIAQKYGKPIDGHAPGLKGEQAKTYAAAGISTDHECFSAEEALDKLAVGMKILIREGSAAKNFEALIPLMNDHWENMMFCSDDKHPDSLILGHINQLVKRALAKNVDLFKVLQVACVNPVKHYGLEVGLLRVGDTADFIEIKDLKSFDVLRTFIDGELVAEKGSTRIKSQVCTPINNFNKTKVNAQEFKLKAKEPESLIPVIECVDGELITNRLNLKPTIKNGCLVSDLDRDLLKIAVVNRYKEAPIATAFIKNFGLKEGAIASSVAHDSHNIIVVGVDDESIAKAVNLLVDNKGGLSAVSNSENLYVALPVAGLMTNEDGYVVAEKYTKLDLMAKQMGSQLGSPYMSLSFMALLVIPSLKLSDLGLFDGESFAFV